MQLFHIPDAGCVFVSIKVILFCFQPVTFSSLQIYEENLVRCMKLKLHPTIEKVTKHLKMELVSLRSTMF